jgi:hypothetical protein
MGNPNASAMATSTASKLDIVSANASSQRLTSAGPWMTESVAADWRWSSLGEALLVE